MQLDLESLSDAASGAIGSLVSTTVLYPLDTCKTKYQAEVQAHHQRKYRRISDVLWEAISTHQVLSLYQGIGTKNVQSFISSFIYFYGYSYFRKLYLKKTGNKTIGTTANLIAATAAGVCTIVVTQPLDTAASRMQTSEFGKSKGLRKTFSEGTWSEAFDGLGISILLTSNPSIQVSLILRIFIQMNPRENLLSRLGGNRKQLKLRQGFFPQQYTAYDQLKQRLLKEKISNQAGTKSSPEALSAFSAFMLGAISKCAATCLTYPAIRCKVMIQAADSEDDKRTEAERKAQRTISGALYTIWRREGLLGFFKGLQAQILKTVLSSALLLMVKEKITKSTWILMLMIGRYLSVKPPKLKAA